MISKRKATPCMICGKSVKQERSTSGNRQTCHKEIVDGVLQMSECEREKNRRYQLNYRKNNPKKKNTVSERNKSIAICSVNHLAKHSAKKYKRKCLKCCKKFIGVGRYNRICESCTTENSRQSHLKGA